MLFNNIVGANYRSEAPAAHDDFWYSPVVQTTSGVMVTPLTALKASACFAAVNILAESIASIPFAIFERTGDETIKRARMHPLQDLIDKSPNPHQTAFEFWHMQVAFGALYGNAYARIVSGTRGAVTELHPLKPDQMKVEKLQNGRLRYRYDDYLNNKEIVYTQDEIWRIPGFSFDGVMGIAPIVFGNDTIALALATEAFGGKFFRNDATPSVVLEHPKSLSPLGANNIRQSWLMSHSGLDNAFSVAVLEEGMTVKALGTNNKDSQFIEARRFQISEIARLFRIPPHMLYDLEKSSFNNIEQQSLEFVKYTIRPHIRKIEQRIWLDLINSNKEKYFARADLDDLMRGEIEPRYTAYGSAIQSGWMTRNEARMKEDMNPLDGLDEPLHQVNMATEQQMQKQNVAVYSRLAIDAVGRIVASELANVKNVKEDHAAYYDNKLYGYIVKTLNTLYDASSMMNMNMRTPHQIAKDYIEKRVAAIKAAGSDLHGLLCEWESMTDAANVNNFNMLKG